MNKIKLQRYAQENPVFLVNEAAAYANVSLPTIYAFLKEEGMQRVAKGSYAMPDAWLDEMLILSNRTKLGVFSHESALLLHNLTDREPSSLTITVPSSYNASHLRRSGVKIYYIRSELLELGKTTSASPEGNSVPCYDLERTICDIVRSRSQIDEQVLLDSLKAYVRRRDKRLDRLSTYAELLRISGVIQSYMEVLL